MQIPRLEKIVLNMGIGEAVADRKKVDNAAGDLALIAGQRPVITRARKSIATYKLRENMAIGAKVTLRGDRMYEFLDRLGDAGAAAREGLPRPQSEELRHAAATSPSVSASTPCSTRSTTTRSTRPGAWT